MTPIHLTGELRCRDDREAAIVTTHLPAQVARTRQEPGCLSFAVTATADPLVWAVEEWFADAEAYRSHQERVAGSDWGRLTAGIERRYTIEIQPVPSSPAGSASREGSDHGHP